MPDTLNAIEPGSESIRRQLGIRAEDPRVFRPYTLTEAIDAARLMESDEAIADEVRQMLSVGLAYDLMPAHLMPRVEQVAGRLGTSVRRVRRYRLLWETVDPDVRFNVVRRACRLILAWRGRDAW